jgi:hypothetical protein
MPRVSRTLRVDPGFRLVRKLESIGCRFSGVLRVSGRRPQVLWTVVDRQFIAVGFFGCTFSSQSLFNLSLVPVAVIA